MKNEKIQINKNDVFEIDIEDMSTSGDGIGHVNGYTLFIKDTVIEDKVRVKVIKAKKNYGYARLIDIIKPSPYRIKPLCDKARACGGCQLGHMDYNRQLEFKKDIVKNCLTRIGGLKDVNIEEIIGMDNPYHYRNKAQYPVASKNGDLQIGFYAARTHSIIDSNKCYIADDVNEEIILTIRQFMKDNNISVYDEKTNKGIVRHIMTRVGFKTRQIMVSLVINKDSLDKKICDDLVNRLLKIENMTSISLNINKKNTNVILGDKVINLYGKGYITDYIGDIKYKISPLSFYQVNPVQTEKLYKRALEYANIKENETVWDMYCGIGTISLFVAKKAKRVYGVEIVPQAIEDAKENAKINGIENAKFYTGAAEDIVPEMYKKGIKADVVIVDPPRKGCDEKLLQTIVDMNIKRMVYVSCDPATLARDIKWLVEKEFEVEKVSAVDMFPHTTHVETVVLLTRQNT